MIVETPSRLHLTLIDLNGSIGRIDGGVGLTVQKPGLKIQAELYDGDIEIVFEDENCPQKIIEDYTEKIEVSAIKMMEFLKIHCGFKFSVKGTYLAHSGLGSGTQISLAAGKMVLKLNDQDLSAPAIAEIVGRGGTSGIGVRSFDEGGFIIDGGHSLNEKPNFLPSSASRASPPPVIARYDFPEDWNIVLTIPNIPAGASGPQEVNIFQKYCPIPLNEVQKLSHIILMKMMPAVVEKDIESFGIAVNQVQNTGFKKIELDLQDPLVNEIIEGMKSAGAAGVGMSSFGPAVYAVSDTNTTEIAGAAQKIMKDVGGEVIITKAQNSGAIIK